MPYNKYDTSPPWMCKALPSHAYAAFTAANLKPLSKAKRHRLAVAQRKAAKPFHP